MNHFEVGNCSGSIQFVSAVDVELTLQMKETVDGGVLKYKAAAPADHRASYAGSGLPFPNETVAFYATPNQGHMEVDNSTGMTKTAIKLVMPNSYYKCVGLVLVSPTLFVSYNHQGTERLLEIKISHGIPFRSLTYPNARSVGSMFYGHGWDLPVRSQESILRDASYPEQNVVSVAATSPRSFWGLKPPL